MASSGYGAPVPDLGGERDEVVIDGKTYTVAMPVVNEIIELRRGFTHEVIQNVRKLEPEEGETVVVTTPAQAGPEFMGMVGEVMRSKLPDDVKIIVLPDNLGLHTVHGLFGLVMAGNRIRAALASRMDASSLEGNPPLPEELSAIDAWEIATQGREETDEPEPDAV